MRHLPLLFLLLLLPACAVARYDTPQHTLATALHAGQTGDPAALRDCFDLTDPQLLPLLDASIELHQVGRQLADAIAGRFGPDAVRQAAVPDTALLQQALEAIPDTTLQADAHTAVLTTPRGEPIAFRYVAGQWKIDGDAWLASLAGATPELRYEHLQRQRDHIARLRRVLEPLAAGQLHTLPQLQQALRDNALLVQ